jgi:four helix bundle protein
LKKLQGEPMAKYASFRELIAWQKAIALAEAVHLACRGLPMDERFEMGRQLKRSSSSIPANIAEGFSRHARGAYRSHVAIALGSQAEVQTHLELCRRLKLLSESVLDDLEKRTDEVGRLLYGLWKALQLRTVGYAVCLTVVFLGLGPWALGLIRGLPFFS